MGNEVKLFENPEFGNVRVIMRDGEPWFVAKDVCTILEIVNVADAVDSLDVDERSTVGKNDSFNNMEGLRSDSRLISESGLYTLIFKSRKPEARKFRKWVTSDVIPSIRKTGKYQVPTWEDIPQPLTLEDQTGSLIRFYSFYYPDKNQVALAVNKSVRKISGMDMLALGDVELVAPTQEQLLTPTEIGSLLSPQISPRAVNALLADAQLQRKVCGKWEPTEKGEAFGGVLLDTGKLHNSGAPVRQLRWASSIVEYVRSLYCGGDDMQ